VSAPEQLLDGDHAVLRVELQAYENLVRQARHLQLEQVAHGMPRKSWSWRYVNDVAIELD